MIGWLFVFAGSYVCVLNWYSVIVSSPQRHMSAIPLFGAILLGIGLSQTLPKHVWAWLAVPADYGTLIFLFSLPFLFREFWSTSRWNLVQEYQQCGDRPQLSLKLFRGGRAVVKLDNWPQAAWSMSRVGKWIEIPSGYSIEGVTSFGELKLERAGDELVVWCKIPVDPQLEVFDGVKLRPPGGR